jgi:hypothetical protein
MFCALSKERVYSHFFKDMTVTGIMYLDILQQVFIPQLDEDDQEGRISIKTTQHFITLEKCARTSTPISQVGGLVEWCR